MDFGSSIHQFLKYSVFALEYSKRISSQREVKESPLGQLGFHVFQGHHLQKYYHLASKFAHKVMGYLETFAEVIRAQPIEEIGKVRGMLLNDGILQQGRHEN